MIDSSWGRSKGLHYSGVGGVELDGGDFWRRLGRQGEPQFIEQQLELGLGLGVARVASARIFAMQAKAKPRPIARGARQGGYAESSAEKTISPCHFRARQSSCTTGHSTKSRPRKARRLLSTLITWLSRCVDCGGGVSEASLSRKSPSTELNDMRPDLRPSPPRECAVPPR